MVTTGNKNKVEENRIARIIVMHDLWKRQYCNTIDSILKKHDTLDEWTQDELMKAALCGVKYINCVADIERENRLLDSNHATPFVLKQASFNLMYALFIVIGCIKLKNLIKIFPVEKDYDGYKWECKDYFYTMDVLREKGLDNAVGREAVFDLMWDYQNRELREATVFYMDCLGAMYQQKTGIDMIEKYFGDLGVPSYVFDNENGMMFNNETGEGTKVINKSAHMQIVK